MRKYTFCFFLSAILFFFLLDVSSAEAASLTLVSDTISDSRPGVPADHTIKFTLTNSVPVSGKIVVIPEAGAFSIPAGMDYTDIDFLVDGFQRPLASLAGSGPGSSMGVSVTSGASSSITFTLNNADALPAGSLITVKIGTNASFGVAGDQQIQNPNLTGSFRIEIRTRDFFGALIDRATTMVAILPSISVEAGVYASSTNYYEMGTNPIRVAPRFLLAGATTTYEVEFPATNIIPVGGRIEIVLPSGTTFASSCTSVLSTIENNDLNGFAPGVITIDSINCVTASTTVVVVAGNAATQANDRIRFILQGIVNTPTPKDFTTSGYQAGITLKNAAGTFLESKQSMPFFILPAGSQNISGTLFDDNGAGLLGVANDGIRNGSEPGISGIKICLGGAVGFTCQNSNASGAYNFGSLTDGFYHLTIPPLVSGNLVGGPFFADVDLVSGQNRSNLNFAFRQAPRTITVNVSGIPANTDLDVFAFSPSNPEFGGHIIREILWNGNSTRSISVPSFDGLWEVGVGPWMPKDPSLGPPPPPPQINFIMPPAQQIQISGSGTYTVSFALLSANRTIKGKVIDGSGSPIPNAFVRGRSAEISCMASGTNSTGSETQSRFDGTFELKVRNGVYKVDAFMPGMPPSNEIEVTVFDDSGNMAVDNNSTADVYSGGVLITNDGDNGSDNLILKIIKEDKSISGKVLDKSGSGLQYAHVSAEKVDASGNPLGFWVSAPTDSTGTYTLYASNGTWKVRGFAPGFGELGTLTVTVSGSNLTNQNLQATAASFGMVTGQATKGGSAASGAFVSIYGPQGGNSTVTDANGNYSLNVRAGSGYTVEGFLPGSGPLSKITNVTVAADTTISGQNLTISVPGTIRVTISGVTNAFVNVFDSNGRGSGTGSNPTAGVYDINVPSGTYTVTANSPTYGRLGSQSGVVVTSGNTASVSFSPPATYTVSGSISSTSSSCKSSAAVSLSDATNGRTVVITSDSSGAFSISLPSGTYRIAASKFGCIDNAAPSSLTVSGANVNSGANRTLQLADATVSGSVTLSGSNITVPTRIIAENSAGILTFANVDTAATSGNNYTLRLSSGTWTIKARSDGSESATQTVTVASGENKTVNFSLSALSGYTGVDNSSALIVPSQGGIVRDNDIGSNFQVYFPAGALGSSSDNGSVNTKQTTAIVTKTSTALVVGGKGVEIKPQNPSGQPITTLSSSCGSGATITIPYTEADVTSAGVNESKLVLGVWSEEKQQWESLSTTVDTTNNTLTAIASHFSVFAPIAPVEAPAPSPEPSPTPSPTPSSTPAGGGGGGGGAPSAPTLFTGVGGVATLQPSLGGTLVRFNSDGSSLRLEVPEKFWTLPITFTASVVSKKIALSVAQLPHDLTVVGDQVYSVVAKDSTGSEVTKLLKPVKIAIRYTDAQVLGFTEGTLKLSFLDQQTKKWEMLASSQVDVDANTVSASMNHLTIFAVIGVPKTLATFRVADFNRDGKVDLVDFSILLYNWGKPKNKITDVNNDNRVDLVDFSILMYWWTG